jgi:hypothetical protein
MVGRLIARCQANLRGQLLPTVETRLRKPLPVLRVLMLNNAWPTVPAMYRMGE